MIPDVEVPELRPRRRERLEAAISFVNGSVEVHSPSSDRWARRHVRATIRFPSNPMIMVPRPQSGDEVTVNIQNVVFPCNIFVSF